MEKIIVFAITMSLLTAIPAFAGTINVGLIIDETKTGTDRLKVGRRKGGNGILALVAIFTGLVACVIGICLFLEPFTDYLDALPGAEYAVFDGFQTATGCIILCAAAYSVTMYNLATWAESLRKHRLKWYIGQVNKGRIKKEAIV